MIERSRRGSWSRAMAGVLVAGSAFLLAACGDDGGADVGPTINVNLKVGDSQVEEVTGGEILRLEFPEGDGREYRMAVQNAARSTGTAVMRLRVLAGAQGSGAVAPRLDHRRAPEIYDREALGEHEGLMLRHRITEAARRELVRRNAAPLRAGAGTTLQAQVVPQEGEEMEFIYAVQDDFGISCDDTTAVITGEVRHVSERIAFVEDTTAPDALEGGLTDLDYQELGNEFDQHVFAVDSAYFGGPSDIDSNDRVIVLFTPQVNLLTEEGSDTFVGGFFIPSDLADSGDAEGSGTTASGVCATSNEAEILYLLAADPNAEFNNEVSRERAKRNARGVSSHEFQHLLNAAQRLIFGSGTFGDLEDLWLSEGLSHVAEEVVGLDVDGLGVRNNLTFRDVVYDERSADIFNTFHISNYARLSHYMQQPNETAALASSTDPGGFESLRMRGFAWIFARWLADQEAPDGDGALPGAREEELFRELASGGPSHLTGIANIERAVQTVTGRDVSWRDLVADFSAVLAVDDTVAGLPPRNTLLTWNLPDVFAGLNQNVEGGTSNPFARVYPLDVTTNGFIDAVYDMEVDAGTARYFTFASQGDQPSLVTELSDQAGNPLTSPAVAQITVVRVR